MNPWAIPVTNVSQSQTGGVGLIPINDMSVKGERKKREEREPAQEIKTDKRQNRGMNKVANESQAHHENHCHKRKYRHRWHRVTKKPKKTLFLED